MFFGFVAACNSMSVCLCDFSLCFQSALELALILILLSYVDHPYTEFLASALEGEFVVAR